MSYFYVNILFYHQPKQNKLGLTKGTWRKRTHGCKPDGVLTLWMNQVNKKVNVISLDLIDSFKNLMQEIEANPDILNQINNQLIFNQWMQIE